MKILGDTLPRRFKAKASGAITAGKPLIVETDGDVAQVAGVSEGTGSAVVFETGTTNATSVAYDSNAQKVVVVYYDGGNSNYGTAVVGTVSGTSISFGTPVVFESATTLESTIAYDVNAQKVVIAYKDGGNSDYGTAIVGTVSGTSISFGTAATYESSGVNNPKMAYDVNAQKHLITYRISHPNDYGYGIVGTVSGTSISFGSRADLNTSGFFSHTAMAYDANAQKTVVAYRDGGNSNYGTARVATISGTSVSFGTAAVFESAGIQSTGAGYDSTAQKVVIGYRDTGNSNKGTAIVGTISGTSISFGTAVVFEGGASRVINVVYDASADKTVISYRDDDNSEHGTLVVGTVSGTSISFGSAIVFEAAAIAGLGAAYDSSEERTVLTYKDEGNSNQGTGIVFANESTNLTSENYIGIAEYAAADTETATVFIKGGVSPDQSSLTPGQTYFVQTDGTIGTSAGTPSVTAGTAVTSTKLIVKG